MGRDSSHALPASLVSTEQLPGAKGTRGNATTEYRSEPRSDWLNPPMCERLKAIQQNADFTLKFADNVVLPAIHSATDSSKPRDIAVRHLDMRHFRPHNGKCAVGDDRVAWHWIHGSIRRNVMRLILAE